MSAERAEEEVKAAADAINKQLPKEAQGGSIQPLVEEKEEGEEAQPLDTFSSEIDSFDTVTTCPNTPSLPFVCSLCVMSLSFAFCLQQFAFLHLPVNHSCWPIQPCLLPKGCLFISVVCKAFDTPAHSKRLFAWY